MEVDFPLIPLSLAKEDVLALQFQDLTVTSRDNRRLLSEVSGWVKRGGITAVLGASAAGKSLLLQSLSGRVQDLQIDGRVLLDGGLINPKHTGNPVVYVPQEDILVGEMTPREMTLTTATLTRNESVDTLIADTDRLLDRLMLSDVADNVIGTLLKRGISGGQKRRTSLATALISNPAVLFVDELTSGLDETIAFEVLSTVRALADTGSVSVLLTIHQPNQRMLELFDHILILKEGSSIFFGTVLESVQYFENLGFISPIHVTITDYFLQISSDMFSELDSQFDFINAYNTSFHHERCVIHLEHTFQGTTSTASTTSPPSKKVTILSQIYTLLYREYALAYRDPTLYYLQIFLECNFCLVAGMVFYNLPRNVGTDFFVISSGISWIIDIVAWSAVFKVYHITRNDKRASHEMANSLYSPFVYFASDTLSTATMSIAFLPPVFVAFFMMNLPMQSLVFFLFVLWMVRTTF